MTPLDPYLAHLGPRFGGAGILLQARDTKRFLFLRDDDYWNVPGGRIEFGESPFQAAMRELIEETSYYGPLAFAPDSAFIPPSYRLFFAQVDREFSPILSHEHEDFTWRKAGESPKPLHPGLRAVTR